MDISLVLGTRPEIVKMAPLVHELRRRGADFEVVHTGQHYDLAMSGVFFEELGLPPPDRRLEIGSGSQAKQTAAALAGLERLFTRRRPGLVLVEGDTNTVLAGALAAAKMQVPVGHVEAGLRSYDLRMPEEHNRRLTDHLARLLFAPTYWSASNLQREHAWGAVHVTGNTVIDACLRYLPIAEKRSGILARIPFHPFALATAHRAENVDDPKVLTEFVRLFLESPVPVVLPLHPRTAKMLRKHRLYPRLAASNNMQLIEPVGYFDMLALMKHCAFVLTDSGGIQEEVTAPNLRRKVFVLRRSTERPEAVKAGFAQVVGTDAKRALRAIRRFSEWPHVPSVPSPYGRGDAARRIADHVQRFLR